MKMGIMDWLNCLILQPTMNRVAPGSVTSGGIAHD